MQCMHSNLQLFDFSLLTLWPTFLLLFQETFAKELWVFWWGEEPHVDEIAQHQGLNGKNNIF